MTGNALGSHPVTGARQLRDGWSWAVLPAGAARVGADGGTLSHTLRDGGLDVGPPAAGLDAVLLDAGDALPDPAIWRLEDVPLVAVAIGGGADVLRDRVPRVMRAAQLLGENVAAPWVRRRASRVAEAAEAAGREPVLLSTSDRSRTHVLGAGGLRRPCAGFVVSGWSERRPTALDVALNAGRTAIDGVLEPASVTVAESGKLIAVVADERAAPVAVARLGAGPAGELVERAAAATEYLTGEHAPAVVRDAMPEPVTAGVVGVVQYALEHWCHGAHAGAVDDRLWHSCMAFLEGLRTTPAASPSPHAPPVLATAGPDIVAADVDLLQPLLDSKARVRLEAVGDLVSRELSGIPLGWAHGDFWPDNIVVRDGRLDRVLDWDTADVAEIPVLDALDLIGFASSRMRWAPLGTRLVEAVLPLARRGDRRLAEHARAVQAPCDAIGLEALTWAWWIRRAALQVRGNPDRMVLPTWRRENLSRPLELERPGRR